MALVFSLESMDCYSPLFCTEGYVSVHIFRDRCLPLPRLRVVLCHMLHISLQIITNCGTRERPCSQQHLQELLSAH